MVDVIKDITRWRGMPPELADHVIRFYAHYARKHAAFDEQELLDWVCLVVWRPGRRDFLFTARDSGVGVRKNLPKFRKNLPKFWKNIQKFRKHVLPAMRILAAFLRILAGSLLELKEVPWN